MIFNVGDVVRMNSGGPLMTVAGYDDQWGVKCAWFPHEQGLGGISCETYQDALLTLVIAKEEQEPVTAFDSPESDRSRFTVQEYTPDTKYHINLFTKRAGGSCCFVSIGVMYSAEWAEKVTELLTEQLPPENRYSPEE